VQRQRSLRSAHCLRGLLCAGRHLAQVRPGGYQPPHLVHCHHHSAVQDDLSDRILE